MTPEAELGSPCKQESGPVQAYSHSMDALVNVDGVFPGHYLVDGGTALLLLATLLCRSHLNQGDEPAQTREDAFGCRGSGHSLKPRVWAKPSRPRRVQASAPRRCPHPANPCGPGCSKPGRSPSQATGALKCSAYSRPPGTRSLGPVQDRARGPGQHTPWRGWNQIPETGT